MTTIADVAATDYLATARRHLTDAANAEHAADENDRAARVHEHDGHALYARKCAAFADGLRERASDHREAAATLHLAADAEATDPEPAP